MQALIKFHETYYSADIMKLAVIGREPLDTLQVGVAWVACLCYVIYGCVLRE